MADAHFIACERYGDRYPDSPNTFGFFKSSLYRENVTPKMHTLWLNKWLNSLRQKKHPRGQFFTQDKNEAMLNSLGTRDDAYHTYIHIYIY